MKRLARASLANVENQLCDWDPEAYVARAERKDLVTALEALAKFWEKNPERWTQGTYMEDAEGLDMEPSQLYGGDLPTPTKMCNMGLVWTADVDRGIATVGFKLPAKAITAAEAFESFIIDLNDQAYNLEANIEGLRLTAKALRLYGKTKDWDKAVHQAFRENRHLYQVQVARFNASRAGLALAASQAAYDAKYGYGYLRSNT